MTQHTQGKEDKGFYRISSEFDGVRYIDKDGTQHTAQAEPFQVQTLFGRWKPICIRHKLLFKNREQFNEHWTPVCNEYETSEVPPSDYAKHLKGYTKP